MMVINWSRGDSREIDCGAAPDLDRRSIGHPHGRRVRPMYMFNALCHAGSPTAVSSPFSQRLVNAFGRIKFDSSRLNGLGARLIWLPSMIALWHEIARQADS